jgi:hypothetical protein
MNLMKFFAARLQLPKHCLDRAGEALEVRLQQRRLDKPAEAMRSPCNRGLPRSFRNSPHFYALLLGCLI